MEWTETHARADERERQDLHHPPLPAEDDHASASTSSSSIARSQQQHGTITLHDHWIYTELQPGDAIHVCSISGTTRTNVLPLSIGDTQNSDLVLIAHPDLLLPPTIISEGVVCKRRAVLKTRLGSTGLTSTFVADDTETPQLVSSFFLTFPLPSL